MNFDNEIEKQRLKLDLQEKRAIAYCENCGTDLFQGEEYRFDIQNDCFLCEDCFDDFIAKEYPLVELEARCNE